MIIVQVPFVYLHMYTEVQFMPPTPMEWDQEKEGGGGGDERPGECLKYQHVVL